MIVIEQDSSLTLTVPDAAEVAVLVPGALTLNVATSHPDTVEFIIP